MPITPSLCRISALPIVTIVLASAAGAQSVSQPSALTFVPGSSVKLYQVNGDCDWQEWDATNTGKTPTCKATTSQTATKADVLGDDVPVAFEHNGELIITFGDTAGAEAQYYPTWVSFKNPFAWNAHDPIARSTTVNASDGLNLNFFLNGSHGLEILPPPQPDGTPVDMGADNVPSAGVSVNGQVYLGITTGTVTTTTGDHDRSHDYSVLTTFDETAETFTTGRTISALPGGHFSRPTFYLAATGALGTTPPVSPEPVMLIFGAGPGAAGVYLSIIPSTEFWSGTDANGNSATRYFSGISQGQPAWSANESAAVPIVAAPSASTIPYASVIYSQTLGLWIMMFDAAGTTPATGMYVTYAPQPWGPWSTPQLVFNPCRDKGFGTFMFYYYDTAADNDCPSAMPAGVTSAPNSSGPAGPTGGDQTKNVPTTTRGIAYGPALVERFTVVSGSTLKLFYMMSTWNPYAVVMLESDFNITYGPLISQVANAEGESPTIAPNTWLEIKGVDLAPTGDARTWQSADFVGGQMPTQLDHIGATVNGKNAYVYYISPTQINVLTPPDAMSGPVPVVVTNNGTAARTFTAQAQAISPSFFVLNGGPYVAAEHVNGSLIGPATLYPGLSTPAKPGETVVIYANGFGPTNVPVTSGSVTQSGTLTPVPVIQIGGVRAAVQFAGLVAPGEFQFNVVIPASLSNGDQTILASYGGGSTQAGTLIPIHN